VLSRVSAAKTMKVPIAERVLGPAASKVSMSVCVHSATVRPRLS